VAAELPPEEFGQIGVINAFFQGGEDSRAYIEQDDPAAAGEPV
jgi:hypothetical protein